jgi:hypothetical protein
MAVGGSGTGVDSGLIVRAEIMAENQLAPASLHAQELLA